MGSRLQPVLFVLAATGCAAAADSQEAAPTPDAADAGRVEADIGRARPDAADAGPGAADVPEASPDATEPEPDAGLPALDAGGDSGSADTGDAAPSAPDAARDAASPEADAGAPRCGPLPGACDHVTPADVREHHMQSVDGCAFGLSRDGNAEALRVLADGIAQAADGYRTLAQVLDDLNREGRPGISAGAADRLRNHDFVGVRWNDGDEDVDYWMPQGITGGSDALGAGRPEGRRLFLVSWYHKTDDRPSKGVRVSLLDLSDPAAPRYRHLLLVEPVGGAGGPSFAATEYDGGGALHAGGIVWWGDRLYVADTHQGLRVFDLGRIVRIPDTDDKRRIGVSPGRVDAHGYRYVVPQVDRYRPVAGACPVKFSFVSLDRSTDPPTLLSGEYHANHPRGRLVHWRLDPGSGWLEEEADGVVRGVDGRISGQTRMQGALTWQRDYYLSSSSQVGNLGRLYRTRPGRESRITAWPRGCEDLYLERDTGLVWTATEHAGSREVVGIPLLPP